MGEEKPVQDLAGIFRSARGRSPNISRLSYLATSILPKTDIAKGKRNNLTRKFAILKREKLQSPQYCALFLCCP